MFILQGSWKLSNNNETAIIGPNYIHVDFKRRFGNIVTSAPCIDLKRFRPFNEGVEYHGCLSPFITAISASTVPREVFFSSS